MSREIEILEGNKLIAEFIGLERKQRALSEAGFKHWHIENVGWFDDKDLCYHSSWDWLMPVVEKIESLHDGLFSFFIVQSECDIASSNKYKENGEDWDAPSFANKLGDKLKSTYCATIQFIEWYNNENLKP